MWVLNKDEKETFRSGRRISREIVFVRVFIGLVALFCISTTDVTVALRVSNIEVARGCVRVAVFANAADFKAEQNAVFSRTIPLSNRADIYLRIPLVSGQTHAIAVFHDINDNGKLDRNLLGIPKEPYAFSNNPEAKWEAPTFGQISFLPSAITPKALNLELLEWNKR